MVAGEGLRLIHTGDTGDFPDIGARLGPFDMAFIPIGAYAPRWFMKIMHIDVPEAVQVRADLRAERGLAQTDFDVMMIGETRRLEKASVR